MSGYRGGGRGPGGAQERQYVSPMLKDPGVEVGRLKVFTRADGMAIVYDPTKPLGERTVATAGTVDVAKELALTIDGGKDAPPT